MADYTDIYSRYKNLYDAQNNSLLQKKNTAVQGYQNQQTDVNNQYTDLANSLKNKISQAKATYGQQQGDVNSKYNSLYSTYDNQKADTTSKYKNLYSGLDQNNVDAKKTNYTDRNNVDVGVNQNLNRIQELMAKNGWLQGGANLQAQLNSNSDRMNGFGNADTTMGNTLQSVLNTRGQYQGAEQGAYNDIASNVADSKANQVLDINKLTDTYNTNNTDYNNQMTSANREQTSKIQAIMDAINSANVNYGADSQALKSNLDAQAGEEVYSAEQVAKQQVYQAQQAAQERAFQAQQASLNRSASRSSGGSSSSATANKAEGVNGAWNDYLSFGDDLDAANAYLSDPEIRSQIINSIGAAEYNKLRSDYESRKKNANSKITSYINKTVAPSQNYSIGQTYGGGRSLMS